MLKNISISNAELSASNSKQVTLTTGEEIMPNTAYSILSVGADDGSIDFTTSQVVSGYAMPNTAMSKTDQDISGIKIVDTHQIVISFKNAVSENSLDFKFLAESEALSLRSQSGKNLIVEIQPPLLPNSDYILMLLDMRDNAGVIQNFDLGIYDFRTESEIAQNYDFGVSSSSSQVTKIEQTSSSIPEPVILDESEEINLTAAPEQSLYKAENASGSTLPTVEEVAAAATETPATGAETAICIFLSIFLNAFYLYARRKGFSFRS